MLLQLNIIIINKISKSLKFIIENMKFNNLYSSLHKYLDWKLVDWIKISKLNKIYEF